jgi:predicted RNase H-like nuclease (RuvC/YqgF family)
MPPGDLTAHTHLLLAAGSPATSPITALFIALVGGGLFTAAVAVYKARPERNLVVASTSEKQVTNAMAMLAAERERANRAELRAEHLETENDALQAELEQLRDQVVELSRRLDEALARTHHARRSQHADPSTGPDTTA